MRPLDEETGSWRWIFLVVVIALAAWILWYGAHHPAGGQVQHDNTEDAP